MQIPGFILRKLIKKRSLEQIDEDSFEFVLQNPLANVHFVKPLHVVLNGTVPAIQVEGLDVQLITPQSPFPFPKGSKLQVRGTGVLLRGTNRLHLETETEEYGHIEAFYELEWHPE